MKNTETKEITKWFQRKQQSQELRRKNCETALKGLNNNERSDIIVLLKATLSQMIMNITSSECGITASFSI